MKLVLALFLSAPLLAVADTSGFLRSSDAEDRQLAGSKTCDDHFINFKEFENGDKSHPVTADIDIDVDGRSVKMFAWRKNKNGVFLTRKNRAMIFNTNIEQEQDPDLFVKRGNAVIVSEDLVSEKPDDNELGGRINFAFDPPANRIKFVQAADIDDDAHPRGPSYILGKDKDGKDLPQVLIPEYGEKSFQTVALPKSYKHVKFLNVTLGGSGAIPKIKVKYCDDCVRDEVPVACAKCGQILECYVDAPEHSENYNAIKDYILGEDTGFCGYDSKKPKTPRPALQQCDQRQSMAVYPASDKNNQWCPRVGHFQCKAGAGKGKSADLSNWATYLFEVDCGGKAAYKGNSRKCKKGTCKCVYGKRTFCADCHY